MTEPPDFEAVYRAREDPWQVAGSWYEQRKRAVLLSCLPKERYPRAWEPACGIGVTTEALAARCDELVASDPSATAVERTRRRTTHLPHVTVLRSSLPAVPLRGGVDLVVVSEVLYYLEDPLASCDAVWSVVRGGADVVLVHWAHRPHDAFADGPQTHALVRDDALSRGATHVVEHRDQDFVLDVLEAPR